MFSNPAAEKNNEDEVEKFEWYEEYKEHS